MILLEKLYDIDFIYLLSFDERKYKIGNEILVTSTAPFWGLVYKLVGEGTPHV